MYERLMEYAKNHKFLRLFVTKGAITEIWYKTRTYGFLAIPVTALKSKGIQTDKPFTAASFAVILAMLGIIPGGLWRDIYVFFAFAVLSVLFILSSKNLQAAVNYSIFLMFFIVSAVLLIFDIEFSGMLLHMLIVICLSVLLMYVIDGFSDVYMILCGIYLAAVARSAYVVFEYFTGRFVVTGFLHSSAYFSEFLVMLFPFALSFALLQPTLRRKIAYASLLLPLIGGMVTSTHLAGYIGFFIMLVLFTGLCSWKYLLPLLFAMAVLTPAVIFTLGKHISAVWQQQNQIYGTESNIFGYALMAQKLYQSSGTIGTAPFLDIYNAYVAAKAAQSGWITLLFNLGFLAILLFLGYTIRLIRQAIIELFNRGGHSAKKNETRIVICAGVAALVGMLFMAPFGVNWLSVKTLFTYWTVIGIIGGVTKCSRCKG